MSKQKLIDALVDEKEMAEDASKTGKHQDREYYKGVWNGLKQAERFVNEHCKDTTAEQVEEAYFICKSNALPFEYSKAFFKAMANELRSISDE